MSLDLPISPSTRVSGPYVASAGQTAFSVTFPFQEHADIRVETRASDDDTWTLAVLGVDYSVSGAGAPAGGTITFGTGRAAGTQVSITGRAVIAALLDAVPAGGFRSDTFNSLLDRVTIWVQEARRDVDAANGRLDVLEPLTASLMQDVGNLVAGFIWDFPRSEISNRAIATQTLRVNGWEEAFDRGYGALYIRGTSSGPLAIKDAAGTWWNLYTGRGVKVGHCGVKCNGGDDTAAFRLAWDIACASSNPLLILEAGLMRIATATQPFNVVSNMLVLGKGKGISEIKWIEGSLSQLFGRKYDVAGRVSNVTFRDFAVIGTHGDDGDYTQADHYPFLTYNCDSLLYERVRVEKSRVMGIVARASTDVRAKDSTVRYCARDGINFSDCDDVDFDGNLIEFVDDDAIAWHNDVAGRVDRRCNARNNRIRFAQGIKLLGAATGVAEANTLEFIMGQGITTGISTRSGTEGRNATSGVSINSNTIKNCIDRAAVDGLNTGAPYIYISGRSAQAGGLAAIPGENDTGTGTIIDPMPYFTQSGEGGVTTAPVPGSWALNVGGNTLVRDIPSGVSLSSLGFGVFYTRNGPVDIASIPESALRQDGVRLAGIIKALSVSVNVMAGIGHAVFLMGDAKVDGLISSNKATDVSGGITVSGGNTLHQSIVSEGNVWDCDPFLKSAGRGANGTWTSASAGPAAILLQNAYGIVSRNDTFKNCSRVSDAALNAAAGTSGRLYVENGLLVCQPTATSFQTTNKGIGECPRAGPAFWYVIMDSDPASATYGNVLNFCGRQAASIPTSGFYVYGMFVQNTGPTISGGKVLLGWARLTNGSGHTAGTDWTPVYATTS